MTTLSTHTTESIFPDYFVFDPERWLGDAGCGRRKIQMVFGKGGRKCLGIELARAELYSFTATLLRNSEMELWETNKNDVKFAHEYQVAMPDLNSKGVRVLAKAR